MKRERVVAWLLRLAGATEILAFVAVVMPRSWMESSHAWLGMGEMQTSPLLMFMIRQASYTYGMHGVGLWLVARDVRRFRPFVILNGVAFLLAAPVFYLIDESAGMPWWWTLSDVLGVGLFGAALLWLTLTDKEVPGSES
jgi:hypothetical protein